MGAKLKFILIGVVLLVILKTCFPPTVHAQVAEPTTGPTNASSKPYARVEITSSLVEDGYSQTQGSWGLQSDIGYEWDQFRFGVRGSNVYFENERTHLTLQPHIAIIANFQSGTKFFIEHEMRKYYNDSRRDGGRSSLNLEFNDYKIIYETKGNWEGLNISKGRWSFTYFFDWGNNFSSSMVAGYNQVDEANTPNFFDASADIQYRKDNVIYYAEAIALSGVVDYIPNGQSFTFRVGLRAGF